MPATASTVILGASSRHGLQVMNWLALAWHFVFGWAGIDMLIGFAAVAVAVFVPLFRRWAIATAIVAFTCMGCIAYGYNEGLKETKRQWDAALAREAAAGNQARSDAVATVGPVPSDRGMFRGDPDNRDGGKQAVEHRGALLGLDPYHLFRRPRHAGNDRASQDPQPGRSK
jgi:hypothetical protein